MGNANSGERACGRQRLRPGAVWVFVRTRASHVCGSLWICSRGRAAAGAFVYPWLCAAALRRCPRLRACAWLWASVGTSRVSAYVVGACRRVWAGCPQRVCAPRAQLRPTSPLSTQAHDLAPNFSPDSSATARPPHRSPAGGAGSPPPLPPKVPGPQGAAMGLVVGGIRSAWGLAGQGLGGALRIPLQTPAGRRRREVGPGLRSWAGERKGPGAGVALPALLGKSVTQRVVSVWWGDRLRFETRSPFAARPRGRGTNPPTW